MLLFYVLKRNFYFIRCFYCRRYDCPNTKQFNGSVFYYDFFLKISAKNWQEMHSHKQRNIKKLKPWFF